MRYKGNAIRCLEKALHHLSTTERLIRLMDEADMFISAVTAGVFSVDILVYRQGLVEEDIKIGLQQLERIRSMATEKGYADIAAILDEKFEYGHSLGDSAETGPSPG